MMIEKKGRVRGRLVGGGAGRNLEVFIFFMFAPEIKQPENRHRGKKNNSAARFNRVRWRDWQRCNPPPVDYHHPLGGGGVKSSDWN